ncbi:MAG: VWA domain-containing protein [Coxiellaceae bacterium]|nr:VWA domain-containing protein [Coxiellaceae bacterium]
MMFHFIRPWCLFAVIPIALLVVLWQTKSMQHNNWRQVCDPHLLPSLLSSNDATRSYWGRIILWLAVLLCIIALAGPSWSHYPQPVYRHSNARVIVLGLNQSMKAKDVLPSRLQRAKYKVLDLLNNIHEGQTGLIVFSQRPFVVSPLTEDTQTIAAMVPVLDTSVMPVQGSNLAGAIVKAAALMKQNGAATGSIIVITDSVADHHAIEKAKDLRHQGYRTYVMGVGSAAGAPVSLDSGSFMKNQQGGIVIARLDRHSLQRLATAGGGQYVQYTNNNQDIHALLQMTDHKSRLGQSSSEAKLLWKDQGKWFIWPLLVLVALACRRGWWESIL